MCGAAAELDCWWQDARRRAGCWCLPPGVCLALTGTATAWAEGGVEATAIVQEEADLSVRFILFGTQADARLPLISCFPSMSCWLQEVKRLPLGI